MLNVWVESILIYLFLLTVKWTGRQMCEMSESWLRWYEVLCVLVVYLCRPVKMYFQSLSANPIFMNQSMLKQPCGCFSTSLTYQWAHILQIVMDGWFTYACHQPFDNAKFADLPMKCVNWYNVRRYHDSFAFTHASQLMLWTESIFLKKCT